MSSSQVNYGIAILIKSFFKNRNEIIYIPNPGNAGDQLIALGTFMFLKEHDIPFEFGHYKEEYENKNLIYAGGGNLVGIYDNCKHFLWKNGWRNKIIILPHTYWNEDSLIENFKDLPVLFLCREKVSFDYMKKLNVKCEIFHDMAFAIPSKVTSGSGVINCFRTDGEKTEIKIPSDNNDLSLTVMEKFGYKNICNSYEEAHEMSDCLLNILIKYETIRTNRLHIAIAGQLLSKKVELYPNSYWKNKAVYEHSKELLQNVKFF